MPHGLRDRGRGPAPVGRQDGERRVGAVVAGPVGSAATAAGARPTTWSSASWTLQAVRPATRERIRGDRRASEKMPMQAGCSAPCRSFGQPLLPNASSGLGSPMPRPSSLTAIRRLGWSCVMAADIAPDRRAFWRISWSACASVPSKNCITFAIASSAILARMVLLLAGRHGFSFRPARVRRLARVRWMVRMSVPSPRAITAVEAPACCHRRIALGLSPPDTP